MRRLMLLLLAAVTGLLVGFLGFVFTAMRTRSPGMLRVVRCVNRDVTNRLQRPFAGQPGAFASVIRHTGRNSGRAYETPIGVFPTDAGFVVTLPYGAGADWVQNVLAAGSAELVHDGQTIPIGRPELVPVADARDWFPPSEQLIHRVLRIEHCLRLPAATT